LVYKLTRIHEDSQFSPQMVLWCYKFSLGVFWFCVVSVVWSVRVKGSF